MTKYDIQIFYKLVLGNINNEIKLDSWALRLWSSNEFELVYSYGISCNTRILCFNYIAVFKNKAFYTKCLYMFFI